MCPNFHIRSYVKREGRITSAQIKAIDKLFPRYGLKIQEGDRIHFEHLFEQKSPYVLEIGFGMGDSLITMAEQTPQMNFIGTEVYRPGVGSILQAIEANQLTNIRVFSADAIRVLKKVIPNDFLHRIQIFFPDPWPKRRHQKRRLIQLDFLDLIWHKLEPNGVLHIVTDWENYGEHIERCLLTAQSHWIALDIENLLCVQQRPVTKYERRAIRMGHIIREFCFKKRGKYALHE
jgi:tRNA (guanine-N7-)-methyltransferase